MKLNSWLKRWSFCSYPQRRRAAYGLSLGCRRDVAEVLFIERAEQLETRTLLAAGVLDTTFDGSSGNGNGKFLTDIGTSTDQVFGMALDGSGRIVVGGYTRDVVGLDHDSSLARYISNGSLDAAFDGPGGNGNGKFSAGVNSNLDQIRDLAMDSSGRIVTAGYANDKGIHFSVQRFNANGTRDTSFSGNGVDLTPSFGTDSDDRAYAVAIDSKGRIVVAGSTVSGKNYDFAVARYNTNGTLDTSFSGDGKVTTSFTSTSNDEVYSVAIDSSGRIVVAGYTEFDGHKHFAVARFTASGSLDNTFDENGRWAASIGSDSEAKSVAIDSSGRIVVAGFSDNGSNDDFAVARLPASPSNGSFDTTFGVNGTVTTAIGTGDDSAFSLAIDGSGRIVVVGSSFNGSNSDFALARYSSNGSPDLSFDGDGKLTTDFGFGDDFARDVVIDASGRIVVAGYAHNGSSLDFALARYAPDVTITSINVPAKGQKGSPVSLSAAASNPAGESDPLTFTWTITRPDSSTFNLTGTTVSFTPGDSGQYQVALTVSGAAGGSDRRTGVSIAVANNLVLPTVKLNSNTLTVDGTTSADKIVISQTSTGAIRVRDLISDTLIWSKNDRVDSIVVNGGVGNDILDARGDTRDGRIVTKIVTLKGGDNNDTLYGGSGADSLSGGDSNDSLYGGDGNDRMDGGGGNDYLDGEGGTKDTLVASIPSTRYLTNSELNDGTGTIQNTHYRIELAELTGDSGGNRIDASEFSGSVTLKGGGGRDTLIGGNIGDKLYGEGEDDSLDGNGGNDSLYGGDGNDRMDGGAGNDSLDGEGGTENTLVASIPSTRYLTNTALNDGKSTQNTHKNIQKAELTGDDDSNYIDASKFTGSVVMKGGKGNDTLIGKSSDRLDGGIGDDTIKIMMELSKTTFTKLQTINQGSLLGTDTFVLSVDAAPIFNDFVAPLVERMQQLTKPLQPVADFFNQKVGLFTVFTGKSLAVKDLVNKLGKGGATVTSFVNAINAINKYATKVNGTVEIGRAKASASSDPIPIGSGNAVSKLGKPLFDKLKTIGLEVPILQKPEMALNLLFGKNVDLILLDLPSLKAEINLGEHKFRGTVGPVPVSVTVSGDVAFDATATVGYDTAGFISGDFTDGFFATNASAMITVSGEGKAAADVEVLAIGFYGEIDVGTTFSLVGTDSNTGKIRVKTVSAIRLAPSSVVSEFSVGAFVKVIGFEDKLPIYKTVFAIPGI